VSSNLHRSTPCGPLFLLLRHSSEENEWLQKYQTDSEAKIMIIATVKRDFCGE